MTIQEVAVGDSSANFISKINDNFTQAGIAGTGANNTLKLDSSGKIPAVDGSQLTNVPYLAEDVYNAKNYYASGRGDVSTTGSISAGSYTLTIASASTFSVNQGIAVYGAGTIGVNSKILVSKITAINGTTVTLRDSATYTVSNVVVEHSDHEAIQNCINACLYYNGNENNTTRGIIHIPAGIYNTHRTIHAGYGETFKSAHIYGEGVRYAGAAGFNGTSIVSKNGNEPALSVAGSRMGQVYGISFIGLNRQWIEDNALGAQVPSQPDLLVTDWMKASLLTDFPLANTRFTTYCAIAIDPYAGYPHSDHYPDITIPSYVTGYATQYNKSAASSQVTFEQCSFEGFITGVAIQPNSDDPSILVHNPPYFDGNADFISFIRCFFYCNAYGLSWGHTQARQYALDQCVFGRIHTCITTGTHGRLIGKPDILCSNSAFEICMRWFHMPTLSYGGTPLFSHCRGELIYRIGDGVTSYVSGPSPITFISCEFGMGWQSHGVPQSCIANDGPTNFIGCMFNPTSPSGGYPLGVPFDVTDKYLTIDGCTFQCGYEASLLSQKHAVNGTGGLLVRSNGTNLAKANFTGMTRWDLNTGSLNSNQIFSPLDNISNRVTCSHVYSKLLVCNALDNGDSGVPRMTYPIPFDKGQTSPGVLSFSKSGRVLTVSGIALPQYTFPVSGGDVGDLIYDDETKTHYVIQSWDNSGPTGTWKLFALTNYTNSGGLNTVPTGSGYFWILNTRVYTPTYPIFGDVTSGSGVVSNLKIGNGTSISSNTTHYTVADDWVYEPQLNTYLWSTDLTKVYSIGTGTMTIQYYSVGDVTADKTITRKRFGTFVRKSPTNDT